MRRISKKFKPPWPLEHFLSISEAIISTWRVVPKRGSIPDISFKVEWKRKLALVSPRKKVARPRASTAQELLQICKGVAVEFEIRKGKRGWWLDVEGIPTLGPSEVKWAGSIVDWIAEGLQPLLPESVEAQLDSLVLAGHSRGGKTAFAVALGYVQTKLKFSVLIGIDPVAGLSKCKICQTLPHILTYEPRSFNLGIPVLVIGTGLGPEPNSFTMMACAPDGVNHEEFYRECRPPCAHFVAKEYGHMDMLDDDIPGIIDGVISKCLCKNGVHPRELMRKTVAGLVVAFLRAYLKAQFEDLEIILKDPGLAPTKLEQVEYVPE
ncbi:Chlorophyllase [Arachis hypogaea]|nr:Chlorophyllase [Arachis hypogaea]